MPFRFSSHAITVTFPNGQYMLTSLTPKAKEIIATKQWSGDWWQMQSLHVHKQQRAKGFGHTMVHDAQSRSKGMNTSIILTAKPYVTGSMTLDDLVKFYMTHEFEPVIIPARDIWLVWHVGRT